MQAQKERKLKMKKSIENDGPARKKKKKKWWYNRKTYNRKQNKCEEKESISNNKEEKRTTGITTVDEDHEVKFLHSKIIEDGSYYFCRVFQKAKPTKM